MRQVQSSRQLHHFSLEAIRDFLQMVHRAGLGLESQESLASLVATNARLDENNGVQLLLELATGDSSTPDLLDLGGAVGLAHVLEGIAGLFGTNEALDAEDVVAGLDVLLALNITAQEGLEQDS